MGVTIGTGVAGDEVVAYTAIAVLAQSGGNPSPALLQPTATSRSAPAQAINSCSEPDTVLANSSASVK
jgi:hypothetical protein